MNRDVSVVIQCAAGKNANVGHFMSEDGRKTAREAKTPTSAVRYVTQVIGIFA